MMGLNDPLLMKDQIAIVIRCHLFFKEAQTEWIKRLQKTGR